MATFTIVLMLLLHPAIYLFSEDASTEREYWPTADWRSSMPNEQAMDEVILNEIDDHVKKNLSKTSSVLVIRHGYIVFERYYDRDPTEQRSLWSATKGVLSLLVGMAIDLGHLLGIDEKMMNFFPEFADDGLNPSALKVTLRHLLTMSDGISSDPVNYLLDETVLNDKFKTEPGAASFYNDLSPQIVSTIIAKATGIKAADFSKQLLFDRLGIKDFYWGDVNGQSRGAYGLYLTSRGMAKIGYLYLNEGVWDGYRVVSKEWINLSTTRQIINNQFSEYYRDYGFYIWIHPLGGNPSYYLEGGGGQFIVVIPSLDVVVVITTDQFGGDDEGYLSIISEKVIRAIR